GTYLQSLNLFNLTNASCYRNRIFRIRVIGYRQTTTHQVPVAVSIVNPADRRPEFSVPHKRKRKRGLLAAVWPCPGVRGYNGCGMWCMLKYIVLAIGFALFDLTNLVTNLNQCITETVEFFFGFALGGFNH